MSTDSNYEARATRLVELWLDNDEGTYNTTREIAREARRDNPGYPTSAASDALKEWFEEEFAAGALEASGPVADLLGFAIALVDWDAIVKGYQEDDKEAGLEDDGEEDEDES